MDADFAEHFAERLAGGDLFHQPAVETGLDGLLDADRALGLFLGALAEVVELAPEVGPGYVPGAGLDDIVGVIALEGIVDAEDREADDQQADQHGGDPGFGELSGGGQHLTLPEPLRRECGTAGIVEAASPPQARDRRSSIA